MPSSHSQRILASAYQQRHIAAGRALANSLPSYSVPIGNSRYTAPGYLFLGEEFFSYPDVAYPWDEAVLAAIREFEPTVMPITMRRIYQKADYGNLQKPFAITRHCIARLVRDPVIPVHEFRCDLPVVPEPSIFADAHVFSQVAPNWLEVRLWDPRVLPWSRDLPGEYKPYDWGLYHWLQDTYVDNQRPRDISAAYIEGKRAEKEREEKFETEEKAYIGRNVEKDFSDEVSDLEWKQALYGRQEIPKKVSVSVSVPADVPAMI